MQLKPIAASVSLAFGAAFFRYLGFLPPSDEALRTTARAVLTGAAAPAANGRKPPKRDRAGGASAAASSEALPSPLQGTVLKVAVA